MLTLQPDTRDGCVVLRTEDGDVAGFGIARASTTLPGYVTVIICEGELRGLAVRVPADWQRELEPLQAS